MKRKRYTEEKIISILKEHEAGASVPDLSRRHGIVENTIYRWKSKYGMMLHICSRLFVGIFFVLVVNAAMASDEGPNRDGSNDKIELLDQAFVTADPENEISPSDNVIKVGSFKVALDGVSNAQMQAVSSETGFKAVRNPRTGQIGVTKGDLIVEYREGANGAYIGDDYGLPVVGELSSISRVVLRVDNLGELATIRSQLELDPRVISTELDVYTGGGVPQ